MERDPGSKAPKGAEADVADVVRGCRGGFCDDGDRWRDQNLCQAAAHRGRYNDERSVSRRTPQLRDTEVRR
jgi:hypothetical protein